MDLKHGPAWIPDNGSAYVGDRIGVLSRAQLIARLPAQWRFVLPGQLWWDPSAQMARRIKTVDPEGFTALNVGVEGIGITDDFAFSWRWRNMMDEYVVGQWCLLT